MAESFASISMSRRGREGGRHGHRQRLVLDGTSSNKTTPNPSKQLITWGPGMQIYESVGTHLHLNHHAICPCKNVLVGEMSQPVKCQVHHMCICGPQLVQQGMSEQCRQVDPGVCQPSRRAGSVSSGCSEGPGLNRTSWRAGGGGGRGQQ